MSRATSQLPTQDIFELRPVVASGEGPVILRATDLTGVHVLKHGNRFMLSDDHGDVRPDGRGLGLYDGDTRFLSTYDMRLNAIRPVVLHAGPAAGYRRTVQMTNPDVTATPEDGHESEIVLRHHSLGVVRERAMGSAFAERLRVSNYTDSPERARVTLELDADYADIFELRGFVRDERGTRMPNKFEEGHVMFTYRGRDGTLRRTHVTTSPAMRWNADDHGPIPQPDDSGPVFLVLDRSVPAGGHEDLTLAVWSEIDGQAPDQSPPHRVPRTEAEEASAAHRAWRASSATIETTHKLAERALERASNDLRLLVNDGPQPGERYVAAGVPWFSCLFGRDSIITSLQLLSIRPQVAQSTLAILARLQATDTDPSRDAQPGKILHELRTGELARAGEIPHSPYYGTVDATPLWLVLLNEYERWTADDELVARLWPNALAALAWIDEFGDADGDGFVEYQRQSERGLTNQGWKDSADSIRHQDGRLAEGPVALVEVQGYVYAARRGLARLARLRGDERLAAEQDAAAERLRQRFEDAYWMPEVGTYALALDGEKQLVTAIASNAGHALWSGIASEERAASVARVLTGPGMWSGWGIRTLSAKAIGYNPIGYHLGTVWPHDNGICAAGFARYGLFDEARLVAGAMLEATVHFTEARLPELFCGFDREAAPLPVPYPVACSPQAWAAGALFHLVGAMLGLEPSARQRRLELLRPALPDWLPELRAHNLRVGDGLVDLAFAGREGSISVEVMRRTGDVDVVVRL